MKAEPVLMIQMPVTELQRMIQEAVNSALDVKFEPLRRQFEDRLIGVKEVCEKLGVTRQTLYNIKDELPPIKIGSKVRYKESAVTAYLAEKEQDNY